MKVRIIRAEETVELGLTGELKRKAVYRYTLDDLGPFELRLDLVDDQPEIIKKLIEDKIAKLKAIQG